MKKAIVFTGLNNFGEYYKFVVVVDVNMVEEEVEKAFSQSTEMQDYEIYDAFVR